MDRERAKAGDAVRPIGWHRKMLVVRTTPGPNGTGEDDEVLCRWHDREGVHQLTFKSGQLEVLNSAAQAHNPARRTLL
jgi:uncharacterized protein YodC (DUF2158 family)